MKALGKASVLTKTFLETVLNIDNQAEVSQGKPPRDLYFGAGK